MTPVFETARVPWAEVGAASLAVMVYILSLALSMRVLEVAQKVLARKRLRPRQTAVSVPRRWFFVAFAATIAAGTIGPLAGVLLAALMAVGSYYLQQFRSRQYDSELVKELGTLILVVRARYRVRPSVPAALETALPRLDRLRPAVEGVLKAMWLGTPPAEALQAAARSGSFPGFVGGSLREVWAVLSEADRTTQAHIDEALENIAMRLKRLQRFRGKARTTLALLLGTVRVLQVANIIALGIVAITPLYREFYFSQPAKQLSLGAIMALAVVASVWFEAEQRQLEV